MTRVLVIMGSGETAPTMVKPHRALLARAGEAPAVVLDTPYGFQENADDISERAMAYFDASVGRKVRVASWRSRDLARCGGGGGRAVCGGGGRNRRRRRQALAAAFFCGRFFFCGPARGWRGLLRQRRGPDARLAHRPGVRDLQGR